MQSLRLPRSLVSHKQAFSLHRFRMNAASMWAWYSQQLASVRVGRNCAGNMSKKLLTPGSMHARAFMMNKGSSCSEKAPHHYL